MTKLPKGNLEDEINHLEQEARMVLPGIQALFGFQLIAVFNARFNELSSFEQYLHWADLFFIALAAMYAMAPAAYRRQVDGENDGWEFVDLATHWLHRSLNCLSFAIPLDIYLIGRMITRRPWVSALGALVVFGCLVGLWFIFPTWKRKQKSRA